MYLYAEIHARQPLNINQENKGTGRINEWECNIDNALLSNTE